MARPSGEKSRCGGRWTEARFNSFIKSLLRSGTRRWAPISDVKKRARVRRGVYKCESCGAEGPATTRVDGKKVNNAVVDHIDPVISVQDGFQTWDDCIERMFAEEDNLQLLCHACHDSKTNQERREASVWRGVRKDRHAEYNSWKSMFARCTHEHHHAYPRYGGRGIEIAPEWYDFWVFLEDMGPRPEGTSLDRIDNDGDYCPENCRWATREEQASNRSNNLLLELNGEVRTLSQWAAETGIPSSTIINRLARGDSEEEALNPERKRKPRPPVLDYETIWQDSQSGMDNEKIAIKHSCHPDTVRKYVHKRKKEAPSND